MQMRLSMRIRYLIFDNILMKPYNMTSNTLTGYLIFLMLLSVLWVGLGCMADIQTPERFPRMNFAYGKEN
jgi:hypothetical protein